eukprot:c14227_g1_i3.p1 GENE.c14227_g1_i3~~c14227_g1_i3.p1  ORF type:complete len:465 (+),score=105.64 c14227_g1_i3:47-1441(+)
MLIELGSATQTISDEQLRAHLFEVLSGLGERKRVLVIPPDFTRFQSKAGFITKVIWEFYGDRVTDILPALGTHHPVSQEQRTRMFGDVPDHLFRNHDWRNDVVTIGTVPVELVREASDGQVNEEWPAQLNRLVWEGKHDLILSVGQVLPHEVLGMANYNKNLFIGVGGPEAINLSHFIGAAYGMERMMGIANNPLRRILNYASDKFLKDLPVVYVLTVRGPPDDPNAPPSTETQPVGTKRKQDEAEQKPEEQPRKRTKVDEGEKQDKEAKAEEETKAGAHQSHGDEVVTRGVFVGDTLDCFSKACELSLQVNVTMVDQPLTKVVAWLDPDEFRSTWLGNKAIYRTRMAIADDGELIVLGPGIQAFGEDAKIGALIEQFGYRRTPEVMAFLEKSKELRGNLSAAAHLIHGSSEGRFKITYCPGHLTREQIEQVGFSYGDLEEMTKRYDPLSRKDGFHKTRPNDGP